MHNPRIFTHLLAWKVLFQHLKSLPTDDCHEFKCPNDIHIEEW
jgi:hypothetical protein